MAALILLSSQSFARAGETSGGMPTRIPDRSHFKLAKIMGVTGGTVDAQGNAQFVLEYSLQPCAEKFLKILESEVQPPTSEIHTGNTKYLALGILLKNNGNACAGPTRLVQMPYEVSGPLPLGGATLLPLESSDAELDVVNFAMASQQVRLQLNDRNLKAILVSEDGGFTKHYVVRVISSEPGFGPTGNGTGTGISTHPCTTVIEVTVYSGISGPVKQVTNAQTICAMNSPMLER